MNTKTPMSECWKIHSVHDKECLDCLSIKDCRSVREIVSELLDTLAGCVGQDCGVGDGPMDNKYSHGCLSAYEDAIDILEKYGKMEPYIFPDGQISGGLMRFVKEDMFVWTCNKCGDEYERPYTSVSEIPCISCEGGTYQLLESRL